MGAQSSRQENQCKFEGVTSCSELPQSRIVPQQIEGKKKTSVTSEASETGDETDQSKVVGDSSDISDTQRRSPSRLVSIARARPSFNRRKNTTPLKQVAEDHRGKAFHSSKYLEDNEDFKMMHKEMEDRLKMKSNTHEPSF